MQFIYNSKLTVQLTLTNFRSDHLSCSLSVFLTIFRSHHLSISLAVILTSCRSHHLSYSPTVVITICCSHHLSCSPADVLSIYHPSHLSFSPSVVLAVYLFFLHHLCHNNVRLCICLRLCLHISNLYLSRWSPVIVCLFYLSNPALPVCIYYDERYLPFPRCKS